MLDFAERLPEIRRRVRADLRAPGFSRRKVLAAVVDILQKTNIRVGNEIYSRTNHSYGLTTLRNHHAHVRGSLVHLHFRAKSGKVRDIEFRDRRLSRIVRRCQELPGQELFCYLDENHQIREISSSDVNHYIAEIAGAHFTAKDFRTWCGTAHALACLLENSTQEPPRDERAWRHRHLQVIRATAEHLGNTPSICEKYYIHPRLFIADRERGLDRHQLCRVRRGLSATESAVVALLNACRAKAEELTLSA